MSGTYVTFNQGVGKTEKSGPTKERMKQVRDNALRIREDYQWLTQHGFKLDDEIILVDPGLTGKAYEQSTIAYKFYGRENLPADDVVEQDLKNILEAYQNYVDHIGKGGKKAWIFQANPKLYDIEGALKKLPEIRWSIRQHK